MKITGMQGKVNEYFSINVDPTARPMNINVDYRDALYRSGENIRKALTNELSLTELSGLERSYYDTCRSFVSGNLTTAAGWAAYASRVTAVDVLTSGGMRDEETLFMGDVDMEIPQELQDLERETFLQIIAGGKNRLTISMYLWSSGMKTAGRELTGKSQKRL